MSFFIDFFMYFIIMKKNTGRYTMSPLKSSIAAALLASSPVLADNLTSINGVDKAVTLTNPGLPLCESREIGCLAPTPE